MMQELYPTLNITVVEWMQAENDFDTGDIQYLLKIIRETSRVEIKHVLVWFGSMLYILLASNGYTKICPGKARSSEKSDLVVTLLSIKNRVTGDKNKLILGNI